MNREYFLYICFALSAAFLNYVVQLSVDGIFNIINIPFFMDFFYGNINLAFFIKIFSATIAAFIFKYFADKVIIFKVRSSNSVNKDTTMVFLYTLFAVFTTLIFWGTQFVFRLFIGYEYLGMLMGLAVGYTVKFFLDRRYVFLKKAD